MKKLPFVLRLLLFSLFYIYFNTGFAQFVEIPTTLTPLQQGSLAFGDYDNDGDLDLILTGADTGFAAITKVFRNKGDGTFEDSGISNLPGIQQSSVAWGDYDNDGNLDILMTGRNTGNQPTSKIYRNQGDGTFEDSGVNNLVGVRQSSAAWGDYDNDGYLDILITGNNSSNAAVSKIYRNKRDGTFEDSRISVLKNVKQGAVAWGDYDNDGDVDILLTGNDNSFQSNTKIYRNLGDGTFEDSGIGNLPGIRSSTVTWGDYDNDGDLDILMAGATATGQLSKVYRNEGDGTFEDSGIDNLISVQSGSAAWGDYDNDGYLDILLTGTIVSDGISKVYRNQQNGTFKEVNLGLANIHFSSVAWGDYDNDGDLDMVLSGTLGSISGTFGPAIRFYRGFGSTTNTRPSIPTNLNASVDGTSATLTWDKSNDNESPTDGLHYNVYIGTTTSGTEIRPPMAVTDPLETNYGYRKITRMAQIQQNNWTVKNLPTGTYYWGVQAIDQAFTGSFFSVRGTFEIQDLPVAPSGLMATLNQGQIRLNWTDNANNEKGFIIQRSTTPGAGFVTVDTVQSLNYTEDNTSITNNTTYYYRVNAYNSRGTTNFTNEASITSSFGPFSELVQAKLPNLFFSSAAWGDYDNDGDLDIVVTGSDLITAVATLTIHQNLGNNTFQLLDTGVLFNEINGARVAWGDYNNDGHLDILVAGQDDLGKASKIYKNKGDGTFEDSGIDNITGVRFGSVAWGDYDNDGDLDIVLTGGDDINMPFTKVYRNKGDGTFEDTGINNIPGISAGTINWGDYDNDGDLDLLLMGKDGSGTGISKVYRNQEDHTFEDSGINNLIGFTEGSGVWGDYDSDGDLDILLAGTSTVKIYRNQGDGTFNDSGIANITGSFITSCAWGDYDNDGHLDILLSGVADTQLYRNKGDGTFENSGVPNLSSSSGQVSWGDYDNDGDLDILAPGSKVYRNETTNANTSPTAPTNLSTVVLNDQVTLAWNQATDNNTAQNSLTYYLRIGTAPGKNDVLSSLANSNGFRKIAALGFQGNQRVINGLKPNTYYWSVQALDHTYAGSGFASEQSFVVVDPPSVPNDLTATAQSSESILLTWSSNSDNSNASSYVIQRSQNDASNYQAIDTVSSDNTQYESVGLNESTTYYYRIFVFNTAGQGTSNADFATTNDIPRAPINLQATATSINQIDLTWQDVSSAETGFIIERRRQLFGNDFVVLDSVAANETSFRDTDVEGNIIYEYRVQSYNTSGNSLYSKIASIQTPVDASQSLPPKPLNFIADPISPNEINLRWSASLSNVESFIIERSSETDSANFQEITRVLATTFRDSVGLSSGRIHYYRIRASNNAGESDYGNLALARSECNLPIFVSLANGQTNQVCFGQGSKIVVTADVKDPTFKWKRNGVTIPDAITQFYFAYQTGEYTCEVTSGECTQTTKSAVVVVVAEALSVEISQNSNELVSSVANAQQYTWYFNNEVIPDASQATFTPVASGTYHLVVQKNGCSTTSNPLFVTINGVNKQNLSHLIQLSPNPANQVTKLSIDTPVMSAYHIWLIDTHGKRILLAKGIKHQKLLEKVLHLEALGAGLFQLEIQLGRYTGTKKIVKH